MFFSQTAKGTRTKTWIALIAVICFVFCGPLDRVVSCSFEYAEYMSKKQYSCFYAGMIFRRMNGCDLVLILVISEKKALPAVVI